VANPFEGRGDVSSQFHWISESTNLLSGRWKKKESSAKMNYEIEKESKFMKGY
jgi:hypothetical protein